MGLRNLGNTVSSNFIFVIFACLFFSQCFMNSMLQCLSQTRLLTDFFVSDKYETKLNNKSHMKRRF